MPPMSSEYSRLRRAAGWCVHLYTALGLICAFCSLRATVDGDARGTFLWLMVAFFVDSTDGMLARAVDVKHVVPQYDGRKLDDITDYINYVFIPVFFAFRMHLIPDGWEAVLAFPLLASAYGFCVDVAKTGDGYFTGFPSYWNVVVFYLFVLKVKPWAGALLIAYLSLMVFWPVKYLYPSQAPTHRRLHIALTSIWFTVYVGMVIWMDAVTLTLGFASLIYPMFYMTYSIWLHVTEPEPEPTLDARTA